MRGDAVEITLTDEEMIAAVTFGRMRQIVNRKTKNTRRSPAEDSTLNVIGCMGELAFSRWANLAFDFSIGARNGGVDLRDAIGNIDVKTRAWTGKVNNYGTEYDLDLLVMPKENIDGIDVYVLGVQRGITIWLIGWETEPVVRHDGNLTMVTGELNHLVRHDALIPMSQYPRRLK